MKSWKSKKCQNFIFDLTPDLDVLEGSKWSEWIRKADSYPWYKNGHFLTKELFFIDKLMFSSTDWKNRKIENRKSAQIRSIKKHLPKFHDIWTRHVAGN